jgi:MFS transporter, SP family, sugar:H+ symporter
MFTNRIRAPALAVGAGAQWTTSFIVAMSFPMLLQAIGLGWVFCLYAVAAAASYWTVLRYVPETRGRMLEEMSDEHPVRSFH